MELSSLRIDCKELGNETLPVFVPEIRKFAQDNLGKIMSFYCEQVGRHTRGLTMPSVRTSCYWW